MELSPAKVKYLLTIYELNPDTYSVRSVDIANRLKISRSSVNTMLESLRNEGFVNKELYTLVTLSEKGQIIASDLYVKYKTILRFYLQNLRLDGPTSRKEAINTVCYLGPVCIDKLIAFLHLNNNKLPN